MRSGPYNFLHVCHTLLNAGGLCADRQQFHLGKSDGSSSVVLYLYLSEPDTTIEKTVKAIARVLLQVKDEPWAIG
jgi:hypothetical protein